MLDQCQRLASSNEDVRVNLAQLSALLQSELERATEVNLTGQQALILLSAFLVFLSLLSILVTWFRMRPQPVVARLELGALEEALAPLADPVNVVPAPPSVVPLAGELQASPEPPAEPVGEWHWSPVESEDEEPAPESEDEESALQEGMEEDLPVGEVARDFYTGEPIIDGGWGGSGAVPGEPLRGLVPFDYPGTLGSGQHDENWDTEDDEDGQEDVLELGVRWDPEEDALELEVRRVLLVGGEEASNAAAAALDDGDPAPARGAVGVPLAEGEEAPDAAAVASMEEGEPAPVRGAVVRETSV
jgi:hypothetical protein